MHISEGILTGPSMVATTVVGAAVLAMGTRSMSKFVKDQPERKPLLGMAGAFIFLVSLIPIPAFTGTTSHPCGTPLAGILLGPWIGAGLASLSLALQAAFFAHGGFSSLGANTINLGFLGAGSAWLVYQMGRKTGLPIWAAAGLGGLTGDIMTYIGAGGMLAGHLAFFAPEAQYSFFGYLKVIYGAYVPTQSWIALGEMIITGYAVNAIHRQRPEVLEALGAGARKIGMILVMLAGSALLIGAAPVESKAHGPQMEQASADGFVGMDEGVNEKLAEAAGAAPADPVINTEAMGDLWNTLLLAAGGLCGFIIGRWWHLLFGKEKTA